MKYRGLDPRTVAKLRERDRRTEGLKTRIGRALAGVKGLEMARAGGVVVGGEKMPGDRTISGYGSVFNNPDHVGDIIAPGAFDAWLRWYRRQTDPLLLLDHHAPLKADGQPEDPSRILGYAEQLYTDDHGLFGAFRLLPESGERVFREYRTGKVDGLSIGYYVNASRDPTWQEREWGAANVLTDVSVREISLVKTPANSGARVFAAKSRGEDLVDGVRAALARQRGEGYAGQDALDERIRATLARARMV